MIRIGAIMSDGLVSSLRESLEGLDVVVVALGSSFRRIDSPAASALEGIVCELSEAALDGHADQASWFGSMPCAGLPVVSHAHTLASAAGIATVIRGPEDLSQWLASLAVPEGISLPATAGHIIAVWGPAGSPGRSTLALCLAATLARRNQRVIVVDAVPVGEGVSVGVSVGEGEGDSLAVLELVLEDVGLFVGLFVGLLVGELVGDELVVGDEVVGESDSV
jgi:hypothetical protein